MPQSLPREFAAILLAALVILAPSAAVAARLVAIGSDVTEILFALGAGDEVVAIDDSSAYLPGVPALPRVGYMRALSAEGTIAQRPDLVLVTHGAGPDAVLAQLRAAGVRIEMMPEARNAASLADKIRRIASSVGRQAEGERLAAAVTERLTAIAARIAAEPPQASAIVILAAAPGRIMAGGTDTAADAVLTLAGARNAFGGTSGYKPLTPEAAVAANPDLIIVPSHVLAIAGDREAILADRAIASTRAGREGRLLVVDTVRLLSFGPRLPDAVEEVHAALREARR
jgi:iron complex transport system substrate-binding protein